MCSIAPAIVRELVRPEGLEPPAYWFEANRSIQLSYGRTARTNRFDCNRAPLSASGDREKCLASGMDEYLAKPVGLTHLEEAIGKCPAGVLPPQGPPVRTTVAGAFGLSS